MFARRELGWKAVGSGVIAVAFGVEIVRLSAGRASASGVVFADIACAEFVGWLDRVLEEGVLDWD